MSSIRTRFAPSPTGQVHIGNIRVAIYNWLFARRMGGAFLLRVEDTDLARSTPEAVRAVLDAMEWLGLTTDEAPVYQSARRDAHLAAAKRLVEQGHAYLEDKGGTGQGDCIVFRMGGREGFFNDLVKGPLRKAAEHMVDFVIVRSDGSPVFHLANVVDDIDMGTTHVIRGDDHVENTFRHVALYEALGAPVPQFAHLPMIVNAQGKPYSKRDGDAFVGDFRHNDILPAALFNYLVLLGWASGDDQEIFTRDELVERFSLERVQSSSAQFDIKKLLAVNAQHLQRMSLEDFSAIAVPRLASAGLEPMAVSPARLESALRLLQPRVRVTGDVVAIARPFLSNDFPVDEKAAEKRLRSPEAPRVLLELLKRLENTNISEPSLASAMLHDLAESLALSPGVVNPIIRLVLTGLAGGPELADVMAWLGPQKCHMRALSTLSRIAPPQGPTP